MSSYRLNKELPPHSQQQIMQQNSGNNSSKHNNQDSEITSEHKPQLQQSQIDTATQNEL